MGDPVRRANFRTTWLRRLQNDFSLPAWGLSLAFHLLLLVSLATLTHSVVGSSPDEPPRQVGIVTKTDSASGAIYENDQQKFTDDRSLNDPLASIEETPPTKPAAVLSGRWASRARARRSPR